MVSKSKIIKAIENPSETFKKIKTKIDNQLEDVIRTYSQSSKQTDIINQKDIRVVGLRRTGNHAIITWIEGQIRGEFWHLNNLITDENPYRYKYQHLSNYYSEHKWAIERYKKEAKGNFTHKECLVYSYEDYSLEEVFSEKFEKMHDVYLGKTAKRFDILILRDPFNLIASRYKKDYLDIKTTTKSCVELWLDYAKEFLGETNYLQHQKVCINYNQWVDNVDYRKSISEHLGIEFTDKGIDKVHGCGGGSSFEGREFDGKATEMKVHERWKYFINDPIYRQFFKNKKLLEYSERIFGHLSGTETLFS